MESEDEFDMQDAAEFANDDFYNRGDDDVDIADYEFIDNDSNNFDVLGPHCHWQSYTILSDEDIRQRQDDYVIRVSTVLSISKVSTNILLHYYNWSVSEVNNEWFADEDKVRRAVGLLEGPVIQFPDGREVRQSIRS